MIVRHWFARLLLTLPLLAGQPASFAAEIAQGQRQANELLARQFSDTLARRWSGGNEALFAFLDRAYLDQVVFFGTVKPAAEILKLKQAYAERWPQRSYVVRPASLDVVCDDDQSCLVNGIVDWDFSSPERHAHSVGVGSFHLELAIHRGSTKIKAESSAVLSRQ